MEVYRRLWPYLLRYRWRLLLGVVFVVCQIFFQVQIPVVVGEAFDFLRKTATGESPASASVETVAADTALSAQAAQAAVAQVAAAEMADAEAVMLEAAQVSVAHQELLTDYVRPIFFLGSISVIFLFLKRWLVVSASRHVEFAFRNDFFKKILSLSISFFDRHKTGDIMARATNDLESVRQVIGPGILYPINSVATIVFAYYQMIKINALLALVTLAPALGLFVGMRFFGKRLFLYSKNVQDQFGELSSVVQENLAGMRTIRAYVREANEEAKFDSQSRAYIGYNLKLASCRAAFFPSLLLMVFWGMGLLLFSGGWMVEVGELTIGELIAFVGILQFMIWPLIALGWIVSVIQRGAAAMSRMAQVLDAQPDTADRARTRSPEQGVRGLIEFRGLTFHYPGVEAPILEDIKLEVPPGSSLGVIGPTGSGKTTLVSLLGRFHQIADGQLFIDGVDINDYAATELRNAQGIVTQETFLFSDTIANNIAFSSGNGQDRARIEECARRAQLTSEVEQLPNKYDTVLGERGINLSGGQKQRVAIARALYRDPRILILDDALAAVDAETEGRILEELRRFMAGRATLLVSHRVSTVAPADEIIFLDEGRIIERGTHEELLELNGRYAKLYRRQLLASEIEMMNDE